MKIIEPVRYPQLTILPTTWGVPLSNYPTWVSGTAYTVGNRVAHGDYEYEALAPSTGDPPDVGSINPTPTWLRLGWLNRLKAFDQTIYDQAVSSGNAMAYFLTAPTTISAIALFNLNARSIRIDVYAAGSSTSYFNKTLNLVSNEGIDNWLAYFAEPVVAMNEAVLDGITAYPGETLKITIDAPGAIAKIGQIVVGRSYDLGTLCEGSTIGLQDYSRKERDQWGNPIIVERPYAQRVDYNIEVDNASVRDLRQLFARIRAKPAVFFDDEGVIDGVDWLGTMTYGYYKDFSVSLVVGETSHMSLTVEGLV